MHPAPFRFVRARSWLEEYEVALSKAVLNTTAGQLRHLFSKASELTMDSLTSDMACTPRSLGRHIQPSCCYTHHAFQSRHVSRVNTELGSHDIRNKFQHMPPWRFGFLWLLSYSRSHRSPSSFPFTSFISFNFRVRIHSLAHLAHIGKLRVSPNMVTTRASLVKDSALDKRTLEYSAS